MNAEVKQHEEDDFVNLLQFLESTSARISELIEGLSDSELRWRGRSQFSALENICHLRDLEIWGYQPRIWRIIGEIDPELLDFDGAKVAAQSEYNRADLYFAFQTFSSTRKYDVEKLRSLTTEQLKRRGFLEGVGSVTLQRIAEMMREHDEGHLEDLRVLRQRLEKRRDRRLSDLLRSIGERS